MTASLCGAKTRVQLEDEIVSVACIKTAGHSGPHECVLPASCELPLVYVCYVQREEDKDKKQ